MQSLSEAGDIVLKVSTSPKNLSVVDKDQPERCIAHATDFIDILKDTVHVEGFKNR